MTAPAGKASRGLRVVHVLDAMGGGTKKHIELLVAAQSAKGCQVMLVLPLRREFSARSALMDYEFPAAMRARGIEVEQLPFVHGRIAPATDLTCLVSLIRMFRSRRVDVVHTHSAKAGILGRLAAWLAATPAVVHTPYSLPFRREEGRGLKYLFYYTLERIAGWLTDVMIATSGSERDEIIAASLVPSGRVRLIPNCFDLDHYEFAFESRTAAKAKVGLSRSRPVIGTIARLSPQKDVWTLVNAAAHLRQQGVDLQLVIVGEGEQRAALERRISEIGLDQHTLLTGARTDYLDFLRAFDVFAFPSLWEGLPYAPIEAMAVGTPVVATAAIGTVDLVQDGVTGLLVPLRDVEAFASAVLRLFKDPALARRLADGARRFVEARFDVEIPANLTLEAYREVMEGASGRGRT